MSRERGGIKEKLSKRRGCIIQQLSGWPEIHLTYSRHSTYIYMARFTSNKNSNRFHPSLWIFRGCSRDEDKS